MVVTGREGTELDKLTEEQRRKLNKIGLLFCIVLRDTNVDQTLEQILTSQFRLLDSQLGKLKSYTDNVILILDGFDELSYNEGDIIKIIQGKFNQNIKYIVTCRPHVSQGIALRADSEIRLKGFSESQSKAFIEMFARNRFKKEKDIDLFILKTWKEITSSVDLIEMSTNPSMLQLICILKACTGKIGKDKAEVFKHYTQYLLIQYHTKRHEGVQYSDKLYKDALLKCGKLAMFGLKQNHLQLVFSKQEATEIAGSVIFDLGFLTELPSIDTDKVKVQFLHKSLQEYLAAFYVVNTPGDEGMKLLMEFCSTSQRLMGSQMILSFIAAMSKKMGKVIQQQIKDYISTWTSRDDVDSKSRTSFLISMLKDNRKLTFPLPAILDIDLQDYDSVTGSIMNFIKSLFGQKSTLDIFLNMDGRGVKKINIGVGQYNRLELLLKESLTSVEELLINYKNTHSKDDPTHLFQFIAANKLKLISITNCVDLLFNNDLITKAILTQHVNTVILKKCQISKDNCVLILQRGHHLKSLVMQECGIQINADIAQAVCDLSDEIQIDLSGNGIVKMNTKLLASLIVKINKQKRIDLSGLNIDIDSEIAKAVSDLPDETQIDLSGNKIVQMETTLLTQLINKIRRQEQIDLERINIQINTEIAKPVCDLPDETQIILSGNTTVKLDTKILKTLINKVRIESEIDLSGLYISVDDREACVIWEILEKNQKDLYHNKIVVINIKKFMSIIYKITTQKQIDLSGLHIDIDGEIAKVVCDLPDEIQIDLSGNKIVKMDKEILVLFINKLKKQKGMDLERLKVLIDAEVEKTVYDITEQHQINQSGKKPVILYKKITEIRREVRSNLSMYNIHDNNELVIHVDDMIISWISTLSEDVQIDLSDNKITDESLIVSIIKQSSKFKSVTMRNCHIEINKQIAEAVSELNDDTKLDLSGNEITEMEAGLLGKVLKYMKKQEKISIFIWRITVDVDIVKALSNMVYLKSLLLSGNTLTLSACKCLSESVRSLPQLDYLNLTRCGISNDDCVDLVSSLSKHCPRLRELYLHNNHLSSGYSQVVDDVSKMNNLRGLGLLGNPCMWDRKKGEEIKNRLKISNPQLTVH